MREPRRSAALPSKARADVRSAITGVEDLDSHGTVENHVPAEKDTGHASRPDLAFEGEPVTQKVQDQPCGSFSGTRGPPAPWRSRTAAGPCVIRGAPPRGAPAPRRTMPLGARDATRLSNRPPPPPRSPC